MDNSRNGGRSLIRNLVAPLVAYSSSGSPCWNSDSDETLSRLPQHLVSSTLDLRIACRQVAVARQYRLYVVFEFCFKLRKLWRAPFRLKTGTRYFQVLKDEIIQDESPWWYTFVHSGSVAMCGVNKDDSEKANIYWIIQNEEKHANGAR